jgi:hypothetical protein
MILPERPHYISGKYRRTTDDNFTWETRSEAMKRTDWRCMITGQRGSRLDPIEVHHGLAVAAWYHYFRDSIPHALLISIHNAIPLRRSVHQELHRDADIIHWQQMAQTLLLIARESGEVVEHRAVGD